MSDHQDTAKATLPHLPDPETILAELAQAKSIDDLTGKDGVFARLFGKTLTAMLEGEMSAHLGYEPYEAKGRNSELGNTTYLADTSAYSVLDTGVLTVGMAADNWVRERGYSDGQPNAYVAYRAIGDITSTFLAIPWCRA